MILEPDKLRRLIAIVDAPTNLFVELTHIAQLDPARDFRRADLRGVDLSGEDLSGFDFTNADLTNADLRGTDLSRTRGLRSATLDSVTTDSRTRWPPAKIASTQKRRKQPIQKSRLKFGGPPSIVRWGDFEVSLHDCELLYKSTPSITGTLSLRHLSLMGGQAKRQRVSFRFDVYDTTGKIALSSEMADVNLMTTSKQDTSIAFSVKLPQRALDIGIEARAVFVLYDSDRAIEISP